MAFYRCKMCGGDLEVTNNETVCECIYCGTRQTVPNAKDEKVTNLFNRANQLRMVNRFDEAKKIYEEILLEDNSCAEAHWGIILCKYGIEYVDDTKTGKKIPTCHRTISSSITNDIDYKAAINNSDPINRAVYEAEADEIAKIQRGILEQSANAEKYDVFICYKETDDKSGARTEDSVIAQDLYFQLEKKGYKTFFARKTLENKLGAEYEPIIFSALNSAKVMVVLGTNPEHFESVWLKNEWSRFLDFTKDDSNRLLIPAYKGFSPYQLPGEFSSLQSLDMGKIGFVQDLLDAIDRIARVKPVEEVASPAPSSPATATVENTTSVAPLIKRANMFLEDRDWNKAVEYAERVLDMEPENGEAYFVRYLASLTCAGYDVLISNIKRAKLPVDRNADFKKAQKYATGELKAKLKAIEDTEKDNEYQKALSKMQMNDFIGAVALFRTVSGYKDADQLAKECLAKNDAAKEKNNEINTLLNRINAKENDVKTLHSQKQTVQANHTSILAQIQKAEAPEDKKPKKVMIVNIVYLASVVLMYFFGYLSFKNTGDDGTSNSFFDGMMFLFAFVYIVMSFVYLAFDLIFCSKYLGKKGSNIVGPLLLLLFVPIVSAPLMISESVKISKNKVTPEMIDGLKRDADSCIAQMNKIDADISTIQDDIKQLKARLQEVQKQ